MALQYDAAFNGIIKEIKGIRVDNFTDKNQKAYFLSHVHSDHTVGMYDSNFKVDSLPEGARIYMSEESKIILSHSYVKKYKYKGIDKIITTLKKDIAHNISDVIDKPLEVTLIPVVHMIGAVMFLFRYNDKTILYTGDFILETAREVRLIPSLNLRQDNGDISPISIDFMYVDATFDKPKYEHFPSRESCKEELVAKAREWLKHKNHRLALFSKTKYSYDDLYKALYDENKKDFKIFVEEKNDKQLKPDWIHQLYRDLYGNDNFLTDDPESKIHICKKDSWSNDHKDCGVEKSKGFEYLHIYISARYFRNYQPGSNALIARAGSEKSFNLCFPTHCSRSQFQHFIRYFGSNVTRFAVDTNE